MSKGRNIFLCPLCHSCLHLDVAGRLGHGKVIWLPEISQEMVNALALAQFVVIKKAEIYKRSESTKSIVSAAERLYQEFDRRSEIFELMLGGRAMKTLLPKDSLSDPSHLASMLKTVMEKHKMAPSVAARRMQGLRLLPAPAPFEKYIDLVAGHLKKSAPVNSWMERMEAKLAEAEQVRKGEGDVTFDGSAAVAV